MYLYLSFHSLSLIEASITQPWLVQVAIKTGAVRSPCWAKGTMRTASASRRCTLYCCETVGFSLSRPHTRWRASWSNGAYCSPDYKMNIPHRRTPRYPIIKIKMKRYVDQDMLRAKACPLKDTLPYSPSRTQILRMLSHSLRLESGK